LDPFFAGVTLHWDLVWAVGTASIGVVGATLVWAVTLFWVVIPVFEAKLVVASHRSTSFAWVERDWVTPCVFDLLLVGNPRPKSIFFSWVEWKYSSS
jgi:hypothetical protein